MRAAFVPRLFFLLEQITALKWIRDLAVTIVLVVAYKILLSSLCWRWLLSCVCVCGGGGGGLVEFSVVVAVVVFSLGFLVFIVLFVALIVVIACLVVLVIFVFLARALALVSCGCWYVLEEVLPLSRKVPVHFICNPLYSLFFFLSSRDCSFNLIKEISSTSLASLSSLITL